MSKRSIDQVDEEPKKKLNSKELKEALEIFEFVKPYKWYFLGAFFMLVLSSLLTMVFPQLAGVLTDIATGSSKYNLTLKDIGYILLVVLLVQGFTSYAQVILNAIVSEKSMADLRKVLYAKLISLPIFFFEKNRVGELMSRISSDVGQLQTVFSFTLLNFFRQILT